MFNQGTIKLPCMFRHTVYSTLVPGEEHFINASTHKILCGNEMTF